MARSTPCLCSITVALVPLLAGCVASLDREDVATWANEGSALGVYTNLDEAIAITLSERSFPDPTCPIVVDDGTTVTITGGCTDSEGQDWVGAVTVTRVDGPRDLDLSFEGYGHGDPPVTTTGSAAVRLLDGAAYSFDVDIIREGGASTQIIYAGTVVGDYGQPTLWNGAGTLTRTGFVSPTGTAEVETVDQLLDDALCDNAAASGQTTIVVDGHELVVTYDGETDCDADYAARLSVDGKDKGLVEGVTCALGSSSPPLAPLALLILLGLRRRRADRSPTWPPR